MLSAAVRISMNWPRLPSSMAFSRTLPSPVNDALALLTICCTFVLRALHFFAFAHVNFSVGVSQPCSGMRGVISV